MLNYKNNKINPGLTLFSNNRKAQIGQTVFWLIATLIVIVILTLFIFVSISMSTIKKLNPFASISLNSDLKGESQIFTKKTILAEELNDANKLQIEEVLKIK